MSCYRRPENYLKAYFEDREKEDKIDDDDEREAYQQLRKDRQAYFSKGILWFSKRSGFLASSLEDEIYCKTNHYRLTVPIKIDWNYFDATVFNLLNPYDTSFPSIEKPSFSNRAVILVRGQGLDSTRDFFIPKNSMKLLHV